MSTKDLCVRLSPRYYDLVESIDTIDNEIKREFDTEQTRTYKLVYGLEEC